VGLSIIIRVSLLACVTQEKHELLLRIRQAFTFTNVGVSNLCLLLATRLCPIFFSSVAHYLGTWSKSYWADCKKVSFFFNLIFMSVRIFKFQCDPFSN
jgi:hypothetical protein